MEFVLSFSSKTSSPNRARAIQIAEKHNPEKKDGIYTLKFNTFKGDLQKLLDLVGGWSSTELSLDGEDINHNEFYCLSICYKTGYECDKGKNIFNCKEVEALPYEYPFCDLINLREMIKDAKEDVEIAEELRGGYEESKPEFIIKINDNEFSINKDILRQKLKSAITNKLVLFCPHFDEDLLMGVVNDLPDTFELIEEEEELDEDEEDEEDEDDENDEEYFEEYEERKRREKEIRLKIFEEEIREMEEIKRKIKEGNKEN